MRYDEFNELKEVKDPKNPFCNLYYYESGECFYIEPVFYTHLRGFKDLRGEEDYTRILKRMEEVVKKNKKVIFTGNYECPQTEADDDFIILEINDITDPLCIFVEDKSRGSDYGD